MRVVKSQLSNCLALLEILSDAGHDHRLSDLARALDAPKSSVQRLLDHLATEGWTEQDASTGQYRLTLRLGVLGQRYMQTAGISDATQGILEQIARQVSELVRLTVVEQSRLIWIGSAQGAPAGLMYQPSMSGRIVSFATANGKAWLATLSDEEACAIALRDGLGGSAANLGPRTIRTIDALRRELDGVRARGFAVVEEEAEPGIAAVAVAIRDLRNGAALGTTSVAGPVVRLGRDSLQAIVPVLQGAAQELARIWPLSRNAAKTALLGERRMP